jgi:TolB-like protein
MLRAADKNGRFMDIFTELKRRNVFRVGAAYLLFAWVIIQATDTVGPALNLPEWTLAFVTWIGIIGLPIALFFAWAFELTPEGLKSEKDVDRSVSITEDTGRKINTIVIALLAIAVVILISKDYIFDDTTEPVAVAEDTAPVPSTDGYDSIGVLPFVNMSDDPAQEYFSDGISEELLNALAKLKNLQVAARTSSFAFKGRNQDIMDIGKQLNVETVLEGSVRKSGSKIRITAQLIDVSNGYHLWSETYDRELTDIFAVQDEITAAIIGALRAHFDTGEAPEATKSVATNMSAYDAYLQGRHQLYSLEDGSLREALQSFRAATDADPDFAAAWAARATTVITMRESAFREGIPREESELLARNAIEKALALDPLLAEAHIAQGMLHADSFDFEDALESLEKAVEINPSLVEGLIWRARILSRFGRIKEAQKEILKAVRLDPHNQISAILAANLADEYYEPEFFAEVKRSTAQFERARQILEGAEEDLDPAAALARYKELVATVEATDRDLVGAQFFWLKEVNEAGLRQVGRIDGMFLTWVYMWTDQWDEAQVAYDSLPPQAQQIAINQEELSIMQMNQGKCELALETLRQAHGEEVKIYGEVQPNVGRSNSNLALNRVHCQRILGKDDTAGSILARVSDYVGTLRQNTVYGFYLLDAKFRVLNGDTDGALAELEAAYEREELWWTDRYDPILRTLSDNPRFKTVFGKIDSEIDEMRAELGMPPATL